MKDSGRKYTLFGEGLTRILQCFLGLEIFDYPPLSLLRTFVYRRLFVIGKNPVIESNVKLLRTHGMSGRVKMGTGVFIGKNVLIDYSGEIIVGDDVWLSENVSIYTHHHILDSDRVKKLASKIIPSVLCIGSGAWIAANSIILETVHNIGEQAVVGAGSIVTKDVPPRVVVAGNPAKVVKHLDYE